MTSIRPPGGGKLCQLQLRVGNSYGELLWWGQRDDYGSPDFDQWRELKRAEHRDLAVTRKAAWHIFFEGEDGFQEAVRKAS